MVFGWGKKRQEPDEPPREQEVGLGDVPKLVGDLARLRESQTVSDIARLRDSTAPLIDELIEMGKILESDDLNVDDVDRNIALIVVRGKKQLIGTIKRDVVPLPGVTTMEDAEKLGALLGQMLKKIGDVLGRNTRVIHIFAKKYASQLKGNLETMNANQAEIQKLLQSHKEDAELAARIAESVEEIRRTGSMQKSRTAKISDTKEGLGSAAESASSLQARLEEARRSEHYARYVQLQTSLDGLEAEGSRIRNEVNALFAKISRPLNRYEYGSSLDKEQKQVLSRLVEDPSAALVPQNRDVIVTILQNVRRATESGSISVKDQSKSVQSIAEVQDTLDGTISQISDYAAKYRSLKDSIDSYDLGEMRSLETDLKKASSRRDDLQARLDILQGELDESARRLPELASQVQSRLRQYTNTQYTLKTDYD